MLVDAISQLDSSGLIYLANEWKALYKMTLQDVLDARERMSCVSHEEGLEHVIAASARFDWPTSPFHVRVGVKH
jgi:hypothetical protein